MKIKITLVLISILTIQFVAAQESKRNQKDILNDKRIYFYLDEATKEIRYFVKNMGKDGNSKITNNDLFSIKAGSDCNIFFKWLNPLTYRVAFKDTVYVSPSDIAINDYIKSYLSALSTTNTESSSSLKSLGDEIQMINKADTSLQKLGSELISEKSLVFASTELNLLLLQIWNTNFKISDSVSINDLLGKLKKLEGFHDFDFAKAVSNNIDRLKNLRDYTKVQTTVDEIDETIIKNYEVSFSEIVNAQTSLDPLSFTISNKPLELYTKVIVADFIKKVKNKLVLDKELVQKLKDINMIFVNSISIEESSDYEGYFQIKSIDFEDNQNFETSFIVSKYEIDSKNYEIVKKNDLITRKIIFERYDPVKVTISTGIFYANYTLKRFGVAQGENNLIITEDNVLSNTAIPGTFLNFLFDIGSRNFLPILQLGADPTKKTPFILLGVGFGIPNSRFAITGGPLWAWDAKLDKLVLGQEVSSTTDLEKDVKYSFDMSPKGWYMGLQYNF